MLKQSLRLVVVASRVVAFGLTGTLLPMSPVLAQAGNDQGAPKQVALTQKQIDGLVASQTEMSALQTRAPPSSADKPDPTLQAKMEAIVKKDGFAGIEQYEAVTESVGVVMAGMDPETRSYVGPEAVIKKQIAQVQADKSMPAKDKAQALKELKEAMSTDVGAKPPAGNIELVSKNFDKLSQAFQGPGGE